MVSLVMTTYNGEKYLLEQLDSIRGQTLQPDEVLIFDDCSTDNTQNIIQSYIDDWQLKNWFFYINEENKGYSLNFSDGIKRAKGDIIFLADQDDIWFLDKIEKMAAILEDNNIDLLVSNVRPFYVGNNPVGVNLEQFMGNKKIIKLTKKSRWIKPVRPGCSMCFRRSLMSQYDLLWFNNYPHDCLLFGLAVLKGTAYLYNRTTMNFRRHDTNASSRLKKSRDSRIQSIKSELIIFDRLLQSVNIIAPNTTKFIKKQKKVYERRLKYTVNKNFFGTISLVFLLKYYPRLRYWLTDLYYCIKN